MNKLELIKKLKALANDERGNEEERKSAEKRVQELMKKYKIKDEEINEIIMKDRYIEFVNEWESKLIHQIAYKMFDDRPIRCYVNTRSKWRRHHLIIEMTDVEFIEFQYMYEIYKRDLHNQMELFYHAFVQKNMIFPSKPILSNDDKSNGLSKSEAIRMSMMMQGIDRSQIRRELTNGTN